MSSSHVCFVLVASASSPLDTTGDKGDNSRSMVRTLAVIWGVGGVCALLAQALLRLTPLALEAVRSGLDTLQWVVLVVWVILNAHAEGVRGFHRRFSPRVLARAQFLRERGTPLQLLLAPLFCMSLFHASRRGRITAWAVLIGVTLLVIVVRSIDQPWRGIIDAGVVAGLGIGLLSLLYFAARALTGAPPAIDPDLPSEPAPPGGQP